ncbi:MAG TPA: CHASE domain-containing protein [Casimicrobiaceae bacterium]|nr:CHASE domain-containing protein [Casimicrobiaceae bacterium]
MQRRSIVLASLVLAAGLALTATVAGLLFATARTHDEATFQAQARTAQDAVLDRIETSIALLRGAGGLFASQQEQVTVESFRAYMARVALREQYPGLLGIGFSRRLDADGVGAFVAAMRAQGHAGYRVWPANDRGELHAIAFLEPLDERNRAALGYDMFTNPVRREAMERARDTGHAAASGVVELVQEIETRKQPGFLLYLPVYRSGAAPASLDERRARLFGFVYAPIRTVDFLSAAFAHDAGPGVGFVVRHGADPGSPVLYEQRMAGAGDPPRFTMRTTADVAGQPWSFEFRSSDSLAASLVAPGLVACAGLALSIALAALMWRGARARAAIEAAFTREQAARAEFELASRLKDDFLATLSHEMRTPLSAIVGWAAVLKMGGLSEADRRAGIEAIDRNAKAQSRLIDDLLDMNRVMTGKLGLKMQRIDPATVVDEALDAVLPSAQAKGVTVAKDVPPQPLAVRADSARLRQIGWNLLANAIKFTPRGGEIRVRVERAGDKARIVVADNGEGIHAEFLPHVFERFAQADSTMTRHHGGLGLGLAIVRELVALHGGEVRASSPGPDRGSTFVVDLPLAGAVDAATADALPTGASIEGVRVLVVDDEQDVRDVLRLVLEQRKAVAHCVDSAQEAMAALASFRPDVLVSDIGMPRTNGYEMMRAIRALPAARGGRVPAVALTAYARDEDRREALAAGFQRHLAKPVQPDTLAAVVAALVAQARTRDATAPSPGAG